ncbi:MAG: respiratory nitrate reductase subunit beta [Myxococcales bacterium]|nr:respiratory nitrate reductase subunit beta [Myxococcales bacterium]
MSRRQLAMVMDLNKCIGCQTCTVACKTQWTNRDGREYMYWNNVETRPGSGYPKKWEDMGGGFDAKGNLQEGEVPNRRTGYGVPWDYNHDEIMSGATFEPSADPKWGPNWDEDVGGGMFPNSHHFYLPRICNHCSNPACMAACNNQAIFKRDQDGVVLVDMDRCQGERQCIAACPYKKIYFNARLSKSEKCIMCFPRIEKGLPPACAQQCVGRIRFVGFMDDEEGQVHKLVNKYKVALPLHPEYGTQPNVFYVPPLPGPETFDDEGKPIPNSKRIPVELLEHLFGPEVTRVQAVLEGEIQKKKRGERSDILDILIAYKHSEMFRIDSAVPMGEQHGQSTAPAPVKAPTKLAITRVPAASLSLGKVRRS